MPPMEVTPEERQRLEEALAELESLDPAELPAHPVARAHALVELSRLRRGLVPPGPEGDDVPDPIGGPRAAHHRAARLIHAAVAAVIDIVGRQTNEAS